MEKYYPLEELYKAFSAMVNLEIEHEEMYYTIHEDEHQTLNHRVSYCPLRRKVAYTFLANYQDYHKKVYIQAKSAFEKYRVLYNELINDQEYNTEPNVIAFIKFISENNHYDFS